MYKVIALYPKELVKAKVTKFYKTEEKKFKDYVKYSLELHHTPFAILEEEGDHVQVVRVEYYGMKKAEFALRIASLNKENSEKN